MYVSTFRVRRLVFLPLMPYMHTMTNKTVVPANDHATVAINPVNIAAHTANTTLGKSE